MKYEDALEKIKKFKTEFNFCTETEMAFIFSFKTDVPMDGGIEPAVVMKDTGECLHFISYINRKRGKEDKTIKEFSIT